MRDTLPCLKVIRCIFAVQIVNVLLRCRSILFNIRDPRNPDFRRRVLSGQIQPERLAMMDSVEMASDSLKKQREIYDALITQANTVGRGEDKHAVCATTAICLSSALRCILLNLHEPNASPQ